MSAVTKARCKAVWLVLQRTTEAVTNLLEANPPSLNPSDLRKHLLKLCKLHLALLEANSKLTIEHLAYEETEQEHAQFISVFTRLISALSPLLIILEQISDFQTSSVQVDVFWKVWDLLLCCCKASNTWPQVWPEFTKTSNAPLQNALHILLTWMLSFTRSPDGAWASLLLTQSLAHRAEQAWCILTVPVHCFISITSQPSQDRTSALDFIYDLPPGLVATVCCLVCEQLSQTLPNVVAAAANAARRLPTAATSTAVPAAIASSTPPLRTPASTALFFNNIAVTIGCFTSFDIQDGSSHILDTLAVPSVVQLIKTAVAHLLPVDNMTREHGDSIRLANEFAEMVRRANGIEDLVLDTILARSEGGVRQSSNRVISMRAESRRARCASPESGSNSSFRAPTGPHTTTIALTTDVQVIRALGKWMQKDGDTARSGFRALDAIYVSWDIRRSKCLPVPGPTPQVGCINLLAHVCLSFAQTHIPRKGFVSGRGLGMKPAQTCTDTWHQREMQCSQLSEADFVSDSMYGADIVACAANLALRVVTDTVQMMKLRIIRPAGAPQPLMQQRARGSCSSMDDQQQQQQLQQQTHLSVSTDLDLHTMHAWTQMPGTVKMLEALIRADHSLNRTLKAFLIVGKGVDFLVAASASSDHDMLPACISLAATLQKALHWYTHSFKPGSLRNVESEQRRVWENADGTNTPLSLEELHTVIHQLLDGILTLDTTTQLYCIGSPGLKNYADCTNAPVTCSQNSSSNVADVNKLVAELMLVAAEGTQLSSQGAIQYPFASRRALQVYQLQAILLSIMIPLCHMRALTGEPDPTPWLTPIVRSIGSLKSRLSNVGTMLLSERVYSSRASEALVPICFERFGVVIFNGRLLPGCCNPGCRNMGGASEAGMKTWLCQKCKRARYCSRECQHEAWKSTHNTVCGNCKCQGGSFL